MADRTATPPRTAACAPPSPTRTSTSSWPTASRTATPRNDNGGLPPGTAEGQSGFDPTGKGWYHGGDLKGLTAKLGYIKGLGTTAIWLTPSFKNKAVQDNNGFPSAGYHGYWITDFTQIDPHLGTNEDLRTLVDAAHARGIKVYFDIISNHTADVIEYQEGAAPSYKSKDESPYRTAAGTPFDDRDYAGGSTFPALSPTGQPSCPPAGPLVSFPYHPCVPAAERDVKVPAWLNDVSLYHNRGDTTFTGENSQYGDFFGLDDLFTENPRVVDGMIDIYKAWIRDFGIDGFRMDTMKHVDDAFWQKFAPAIEKYAKARGHRRLLHVRRGGRGHEPADHLALHDPRRRAGRPRLPVPDGRDALRRELGADRTSCATSSSTTTGTPTATPTSTTCPPSSATTTAGASACSCATRTQARARPSCSQRDRLAHALMYFSRGNPVVYYGDEQGFTGAGGDQDARQDMFPSQDAPVQQPQRPGRRRRRRRGQERRHRLRRDADGRQLRRVASALPRPEEARRGDAPQPGAAQRGAAAPLLVAPARASTRSRASTGRAGTSTSSRSTTPSRPQSASIPTYVAQRQVGEGLRRRPAAAPQRR